jgi:hypothetical protein
LDEASYARKPPCTVEDIGAAFVVKDSAGHAYVYYEEEPGPPISGEDADARRSAANIAKLPELVGDKPILPPLRISSG